MRFNNPLVLIALILVPVFIYLQLWFKKKYTSKIPFPRANIILKAIGKKRKKFSVLDILRYVAITLVIVALSEPEINSLRKEEAVWQRSNTDIVICLDVSGSMNLETMNRNGFGQSNRLRDAKNVIANFVASLQGQQVSLVTFSTQSKIVTPLSSDYSLLIEKVKNIQITRDKNSLTAIGMGLTLSSAILKDSPAKSKFIILITDGVNNSGLYQPIDAVKRFALPFGVKVYPIGFNASRTGRGTADDIDLETLNKIASITGTGQAAMASSSEALESIVKKIGKNEKIDEKKELPFAYIPIHNYCILFAFVLLMLEFIFRKITFKEIQ